MRRCTAVAVVVASIGFGACGGNDEGGEVSAPAEQAPAEQPAEQAPAEQPLDVSEIESSLAEAVGGGGLAGSEPTITDVSVDCPDDALQGAGTSFDCQVSGTTGEQTPSPGEEASGTISVKQSGGDGGYEYKGSVEGGGFSTDISGTVTDSPAP